MVAKAAPSNYHCSFTFTKLRGKNSGINKIPPEFLGACGCVRATPDGCSQLVAGWGLQVEGQGLHGGVAEVFHSSVLLGTLHSVPALQCALGGISSGTWLSSASIEQALGDSLHSGSLLLRTSLLTLRSCLPVAPTGCSPYLKQLYFSKVTVSFHLVALNCK